MGSLSMVPSRFVNHRFNKINETKNTRSNLLDIQSKPKRSKLEVGTKRKSKNQKSKNQKIYFQRGRAFTSKGRLFLTSPRIGSGESTAEQRKLVGLKGEKKSKKKKRKKKKKNYILLPIHRLPFPPLFAVQGALWSSQNSFSVVLLLAAAVIYILVPPSASTQCPLKLNSRPK